MIPKKARPLYFRHTAVTCQQMRAIDAAAIKRFGIPALILMENAGRSAADGAQTMLKNKKLPIAIFCGYGNNGGDGFVVARHLVNRGYCVRVFLVGRQKPMSQESRINFVIIRKMKIQIQRLASSAQLSSFGRCIRKSQLLIDAIFGIGVRGVLNEWYCRLIALINQSAVPVLSIDIPSGLNADTGEVASAAIRATKTITMGLVKKGFANPRAKRYLGKLVVADIFLSAGVRALGGGE